MNRLLFVAICTTFALACTARGDSNIPAPTDAATTDVVSSDAPATADALTTTDTPAITDTPAPPDVQTPPDVPATPDVQATPDVPVTRDVPVVSDVPVSRDTPATADVMMRCTRDAECSGATFCDPSGVCVPLVCSPGRVECVSPSRARVCDGRGATASERECPGGCVLNVCMSAPTCASPRMMCGATCTDVTTDPANCGACGRACGGGCSCAAGTCACACPAGMTRCGTACADLQTDANNCGMCGRLCPATQRCERGTCVTPVTTSAFRVDTLTATLCQVIDHATETGDDRGGIAISNDRVIYNGDTRAAHWSAGELSGYAALTSTHDGMFSDLATETVFLALNEAGVEFGGASATMAGPYVLTQFAAFNPVTGVMNTPVRLSSPVTLYNDAGFFSGWGFAILYSGTMAAGMPRTWYVIQLPSGAVTSMPAASTGIAHHVCENGAWWGVAERAGTDYSVVHVRNNTTIARTRLADGVSTVVTTFTDIADVCSITVSTRRSRWYFHVEGPSEFSATALEGTGFCRGTFTVTP